MNDAAKRRILWGIVPDIHADLSRLDSALKRLEDTKVDRIAFLGDFIDAGRFQSVSDDRAVLRQVKNLLDTGAAVAVMGNHELNAILFHTSGPDGRPLREHSTKNIQQHQSFIDQIGAGSEEAERWVGWFLNLPLWFEDDGFRAVHAYWNKSAIDIIASRRSDGRLRRGDLVEVARQSTDFGRAVQLLVCGPELELPPGIWFEDFRGNRRKKVRVAWWRSHAKSWRDIGLSIPEPSALPPGPAPREWNSTYYPPQEKPVFCGHYNMQGRPKLESSNVLCLDYPQSPHCYHFAGGRLTSQNLIPLDIDGAANTKE